MTAGTATPTARVRPAKLQISTTRDEPAPIRSDYRVYHAPTASSKAQIGCGSATVGGYKGRCKASHRLRECGQPLTTPARQMLRCDLGRSPCATRTDRRSHMDSHELKAVARRRSRRPGHARPGGRADPHPAVPGRGRVRQGRPAPPRAVRISRGHLRPGEDGRADRGDPEDAAGSTSKGGW